MSGESRLVFDSTQNGINAKRVGKSDNCHTENRSKRCEMHGSEVEIVVVWMRRRSSKL